MDAKKKYKKKPIKQKDRISETEEIQDSKIHQITLADFSSESAAGGDYVDHTSEEINLVQRDIRQESAPVGIDSSGFDVHVDWTQMAIDRRKKYLYGGRTREGIKDRFNFIKYFLSRRYICLNCHKLYDLYTERCYACDSLTTTIFNQPTLKKEKISIPKFNHWTGEIIGYYQRSVFNEVPQAFEHIRELSEKSKLQLEEVPGTRLKSAGQKLPGIHAHEKEINNLREPFAQWLNDRYCRGEHQQAMFQYVTQKPETYTIYSKTYTVVTNYLERLKLIRLQLWYDLYHIIGGLGDFKDIKKVTIDKKKYIKLSIPDIEGYYSYTAKHPPSNKIILILSPEPDPELDAVEDIQPVQIGRSDRIKKRLNLSRKNILYEPFKKAYHALIFEKDDLKIVIPQEKSFIFPLDVDDLKKWNKYYSILAGSTLSERNPSGPSNMYKEWDMDDYYSEF